MKHKSWRRYTSGKKHGGQRYWVGSPGNNRYKKNKLSKEEREKIIKQYEDKDVTGMKVSKGKISATYGSKKLTYPFVKLNHLETIGNWDHKIDEDNIKIDKDVKPENIRPLLAHEAVEQFLVKDEGLTVKDAHKIATGAERRYVEKNPWRNYQISVMKTRI